MVPNEDLKVQMIDQLGKIGKKLKLLTRVEHMEQMPACDLLIIDEIDDTILNYPYAFTDGLNSHLNGIWGWKGTKVIGLSATSYGEIQ